MSETPKRLAPLSNTARRLYMHSGNECAFTGCARRLIDDEGVYVGELCHIEAAEPKGERFNPSMTNEDRRGFENLLLLCHDHHVVTDDVQVWTVSEMQRLKSKHEERFRSVFQSFVDMIVDSTSANSVREASTLDALASVLEFDELDPEYVHEVNAYAHLLANVTEESRRVLAVFVARAEQHHHRWQAALTLSVPQLVRAVRQDWELVRSCIAELQVGGFIATDLDDETSSDEYSLWSPNEFGLELDELRKFCDSGRDKNAARAKAEGILVDLRFDLLD